MAIDEPALRASERPAVLLRRGRILEGVTLGWNVAGIVVLAVAVVAARSVALAGFGLDSLIEIGASTVVLWELSGSGEERQRRALRLIGGAFLALAAYLAVQAVLVLVTGYRPGHSVLGISWTAVTAARCGRHQHGLPSGRLPGAWLFGCGSTAAGQGWCNGIL